MHNASALIQKQLTWLDLNLVVIPISVARMQRPGFVNVLVDADSGTDYMGMLPIEMVV